MKSYTVTDKVCYRDNGTINKYVIYITHRHLRGNTQLLWVVMCLEKFRVLDRHQMTDLRAAGTVWFRSVKSDVYEHSSVCVCDYSDACLCVFGASCQSWLAFLSLSSSSQTEPHGVFFSGGSDWSQESPSPEIALILLDKTQLSSNPLLQSLPSLFSHLCLSLSLPPYGEEEFLIQVDYVANWVTVDSRCERLLQNVNYTSSLSFCGVIN